MGQRSKRKNLERVENRHDPQVLRLFEALVEESAKIDGNPSIQEALRAAIVLHLARVVTSEAPKPRPPKGNRLDDSQLRRLDALIEERLGRTITVESLANHIGLSESHLSRCIRTTLGLSPHSYVVSKRLERAKQLLAETNQSISQISDDTGFSDQSHLTRAFRAHCGTTPRKYRLEQRAKRQQSARPQPSSS